MKSIWEGVDEEDENGGIKGILGSTTEAINQIKKDVHKMVEDSDTQADKNINDSGSGSGSNSSSPNTNSSPNTSNNNKPSTSTKTITVGGKINAGSAKIYDYAGDNSGERQYYRNDPIYTVLDERNGYLKVRHHKLSSGTTGWFKKSDVKAYKTGGLVDETGLAWLDGTKSKPELVLNSEQTENHLKLTKALETVARTNMFDAIQNYAKLPNFVSNGGTNNREGDITFDIKMYGVNDPQEMAQQVKKIYQDNIGNVRKTIRADVYGGMLNKNSLTRYKY